jgi:hypothetical protein
LVVPNDEDDDVTVTLRAADFVDFGIGMMAEEAVPFEVDGAVFGIKLLFRFLRTAGLCAEGLTAAFLATTLLLEVAVDDDEEAETEEMVPPLFEFIFR